MVTNGITVAKNGRLYDSETGRVVGAKWIKEARKNAESRWDKLFLRYISAYNRFLNMVAATSKQLLSPAATELRWKAADVRKAAGYNDYMKVLNKVRKYGNLTAAQRSYR